MATSDTGQTRFAAVGRVVRSRGFTLLELMIVVAIIAILAALAYPSYIKYITKTRRNAASACLTQYANYMERYYTTNLRYDQSAASPPVANPVDNLTLDCAAPSQTGDYYKYTASALAAATYTITAKPQGTQASRDTACGTLAIDQKGQRYYLTSQTDAAGLATCWK